MAPTTRIGLIAAKSNKSPLDPMNKLYFMDGKFEGHSWVISEWLENEAFRESLIFDDSWYFLRYRFFGRDCICSETSATVRTHLYNLVAVLYRDFETLTGCDSGEADALQRAIDELVEIVEFGADFPVCLWAFGDETTREILSKWLEPLPPPEQMAHVLKLPHLQRHELERLPYRYSEPKTSLKRYRKQLADYNRRRKHAAKNRQRSQPSG